MSGRQNVQRVNKKVIRKGDSLGLEIYQNSEDNMLYYKDTNGVEIPVLTSLSEIITNLQSEVIVNYKVYRAFLNQEGTNAPTATILENTLGAVPTFTYDSPGIYRMNCPLKFTFGKTIVKPPTNWGGVTGGGGGIFIFGATWTDASNIHIQTSLQNAITFEFEEANDLLYNGYSYIEINIKI